MQMGPTMRMSAGGAKGTVVGANGNVTVDVSFALDGRRNDFLPAVLYDVAAKVLPTPVSNYGEVGTDDGVVGGVPLKAGTPLVKTTYRIPVGLQLMHWCMISAMAFDGTDLQIEMVGMPLSVLLT
jgi:hypothetical protein